MQTQHIQQEEFKVYKESGTFYIYIQFVLAVFETRMYILATLYSAEDPISRGPGASTAYYYSLTLYIAIC